ncbi:MAG TPA: FAD:protein FMN transferase [Gemmatimonadales bacterium]|nr:FAD:protein FMN transferase [Gemmatimonadales bacterium]
MNRRAWLTLAGAGVLGRGWPRGLPAAAGSLDGERRVERWSWVMGQAARIVVFTVDEAAGFEATARAFAELRRIEAALSLFDARSDLVALNERAGRRPVRVGADLRAVLVQAQAMKRATGGAFDPAVEPLMRAWGFHSRRTVAPSAAELSEAVDAVAVTRVEVGEGTVRLPVSHTRLDLGGIGVGYGLDRAAAVLQRVGIRRALIDISGDLLALDAPPGERGWPVDIVQPSGGGVLRTIVLRRAALATSANTESFVRYGALVTGHVLNPATGRGAIGMRQATIVAKSGVDADALSTGMLVSGRRPCGVLDAVSVAGGDP